MIRKITRNIKHGARPTRIKHTDFDFLMSHRLGAVTPSDAQFDDEYFADAGLTMPNQMATDTEFTPPTPPMPEGCTDFAQADLSTDLTKVIHNPSVLEAVTHANALGGIDIRTSLDAAVSIGWIKQYFNCIAQGALDYFDTFRLAQVVGVSAGENRSITWGTPWFPSWEKAALAGTTIMPMPSTAELQNVNALPWHDSKLDGWTSINGVLVYRDKSWQGNSIGAKGFLYFPREVVNMVMTIRGTVGFTPTNKPLSTPVTVNVTTLQWIISVLRTIIEKYI